MYHKAALASVVSCYQETILLSADWNCWGLVATAYYYVLKHAYILSGTRFQTFVTLFPSGFRPGITVATTIGGFLVGLTLHFMGLPGEVALVVENLHDPGRISLPNQQ